MSETIGSSGFGISIAPPPHSSGQKTVIDGFFLARGKSHFLSQTGKRVNTMY